MCRVRCVKICEVFPGRSPDERSFATRMHSPLAFAMESGESSHVCSTWIIFSCDSPVVPNRIILSERSSQTQDLFS